MTAPHVNLIAAANSLRPRVLGGVHTPETSAFDDARSGFQRRATHRPDVVIVAAGEPDVRAGVELASTFDSTIAVQATGHGLGTPLTGGVLVTTGRLNGVRVRPDTRTATLQAGATWQDVIDAAAPHGLAPLSGSLPSVGAVSYTLGGGLSLAARQYGYAADHVRGLDLVTPDGRSVHVSPDHESDLFWAVRGGGGNFGIVTEMEIDLFPISRIYGGSLYFDVAQVPHVLAGWREWTATLPDGMTSGVTMMPMPDLPALPEVLRGRHVAQVQAVWLGSPQDGEDLVRPLRGLGPVVIDTLRELPFSASGSVFDEPTEPHAYASENLLVSELDTDALDALPGRSGTSAPALTVISLRHLGGGLARTPEVPNAVGHRAATHSLTVLNLVDPSVEEATHTLRTELTEPFRRHHLGRGLNFSYGFLTPDQVREGYSADDYQRLTHVKARTDPHERLRANHPIPAAG
ncbi:FAD-binding oxidoreductase [Spiractinospora alimapuensis]|uniref:FAD-binding oxidoreductase n=1 Tax=Spiractinospora alimapuensis TaxID=2820884 RepID=UPI001F461490|nr:FAD-binding oxidoreductase [Spiractinospora alimapuensis]QVQ51012.1 FAD-binding oxidoreductase [Spiractinospora alimapuensis]